MILARYMFIRALVSMALAWTILIVLLMVVMLADVVGDLGQGGHSWSFAWHYSVVHGLEFGYQLMPVAVVLGMLAAGVTMACTGELLAIGATGCRLRDVVTPLLLACGLASGCCWAIGQWAVVSVEQLRPQVDGRLAGRLDRLIGQRLMRPTWLQLASDLIWLGQGPRDQGGRSCFQGSMFFSLNEKGELADWQLAEHLCVDKRSWTLEQLTHIVPTPPYIYNTSTMTLPIVGDDPLSIQLPPHPRRAGWQQGRQVMAHRAASGLDNTWYAVEWTSAVTHPLACLALGLLVLPWCIHPWPRRSMAVTLGGGALVAVMYTALAHVLRLLGLAGQLPPLLAPWYVLLGCGVATWYSVSLKRRMLGA